MLGWAGVPGRVGPGLMPMYEFFGGGTVGCDTSGRQVAYTATYQDLELGFFQVRVGDFLTPDDVIAARSNLRPTTELFPRTEVDGPAIGKNTMWAVTRWSLPSSMTLVEDIEIEILDLSFFHEGTYVLLLASAPPGRVVQTDLAGAGDRLTEIARHYGPRVTDWWWMLGEETADPTRCNYMVHEAEPPWVL